VGKGETVDAFSATQSEENNPLGEKGEGMVSLRLLSFRVTSGRFVLEGT